MNSTRSVKPPQENDPSSQKLLALHVFTLRSYTLPTTKVIEFYNQAYPYNLNIVMRSRESRALSGAPSERLLSLSCIELYCHFARYRECENNRKFPVCVCVCTVPTFYVPWSCSGLGPGLKNIENNPFCPVPTFHVPPSCPGLGLGHRHPPEFKSCLLGSSISSDFPYVHLFRYLENKSAVEQVIVR